MVDEKGKVFDFVLIFFSYFTGGETIVCIKEKLTPPCGVSPPSVFLYPPAKRCLCLLPALLSLVFQQTQRPGIKEQPAKHLLLQSIVFRPPVRAFPFRFLKTRATLCFIFLVKYSQFFFLLHSGGLVQSKRFQKFFA